MIFLSMDKGLKIVVQNASFTYHHMPNGLVEKEPIPAKWISFSPLSEKMEWPLRPLHGRTQAEGIFNSENANARKGMTQTEAEDYLLNHKRHGVSIVGYGANGKVFGSDDDSIPLDRILVPSGRDGMYCKICDQQMAKRGSHNHPKGKKHLENLAALEEEQLTALIGAGA